MAGKVVRWAPALALGALWWWGVLRLAFAPDAGALEGAVAAGGWGLSLLPVHCVPKSRAAGVASRSRRRARRPDGALRWSGERTARTAKAAARAADDGATRAWRRRRSGGGSGPW
ncbi:hypothetical protein [Streptomyces sp. MZ04]|uniref:hypothetical protein n=1 Tax=Streptomyces sp. MZ04 TaxID=2559236 RepID=UPI00107E8BAA|nr:hypothetical protein [Streptomyces sp. MZ04]TGB03103.1 hypothetical protein E2651_26085 [Streptomyces sp. MZ04]